MTACSTSSGVNVANPAHGPVIQNPVVNLVYWGNLGNGPYDAYWNGSGADGHGLANRPGFYNRLREYGVGIGKFGRSFPAYTQGQMGVALSETQLESGLVAALGSYVPTANDVFIIYLPHTSPATTSQYDGTADGGHHSSFIAGGHTYYWAVMEDDSNNVDLQNRVTHELTELFTNPNRSSTGDPGPESWYNTAAGGNNEIADLCNAGVGDNGATQGVAGNWLCNASRYPSPACIGGQQATKIWSQQACRCVGERDLNQVDVDATGVPTPTVFRPSSVQWFPLGFSSQPFFGVSTDIPFAGDFDGDGRSEIALYRPSSSNMFIDYVIPNIRDTYTIGQSGDLPVVGDYDGDGLSDRAVWQGSLGWRVIASSTGQLLNVGSAANSNGTAVMWGISGDIPVPADYDGDGMTDFAVARPSTGQFYVLPSSRPSLGFQTNFSPSSLPSPCGVLTSGDIPVAGDYNGDGVADFGYWHPATGAWTVQYNVSNSIYCVQWGGPGDIPVARDFDGDWATDPAIWRPSDGTWRVLDTSTWTGAQFFSWGVAGDLPIEEPVGALP
jgi:hypothetical protein